MTPEQQPIANNRYRRCLARLVRRLWPEPERWEPVAQGLATIDGLRYEIKSVRIEGTYVKERNQHGQERYLITEPDGTTYTRNASQVSPTNADCAKLWKPTPTQPQ